MSAGLSSVDCIAPQWPAPRTVRALCTTRAGGSSTGPFASLNLGDACGDASQAVEANRQQLVSRAGLPAAPVWMRQIHGVDVLDADIARHPTGGPPVQADASITRRSGVVLAVLTADCVPVLLCNRDGSGVAAVHAGWRGVVAGVLEAALVRMPDAALAWIGPCIRAPHYEVDAAVRAPLVQADPAAQAHLHPVRPGHWQLDLPGVVAGRLRRRGVAVTDSQHCTAADDRFFSFRRDAGRTGRQASLIWFDTH